MILELAASMPSSPPSKLGQQILSKSNNLFFPEISQYTNLQFRSRLELH
jgi:hypothetical protein